MANLYEKALSLDVSGRDSNQYVPAKQGDKNSRKLIISLTHDGNPYTVENGNSIEFRCKKPSGYVCDNPAILNADGTITATLTEQCLAEPGLVKADVAIRDKVGNVLSTATFWIDTREAGSNGRDIKSNNELLIFNELIAEAKEAVVVVSDLADRADAVLVAINASKDAAAKSASDAAASKKSAEDAKTAAQEARIAAESAQSGAVSAKNDAETHKTAAAESAKSATGSATAAAKSASSAETHKTAAQTAKNDAEAAKNAAVEAQRKAEAAQSEAETAKSDAVSAKNAAVEAQRKAEAAQSEAETAKSDAASAKNAAESSASDVASLKAAAENAKTAAQASATAAYGSATAAENAKTAAQTAKSAAEDAQAAASSAKTEAQTAAEDARTLATAAAESAAAAEEAKAAAEFASVKTPYVGDNGNWMVWDQDTGEFVDSGEKAEGPQGDPGKTAYQYAVEGGYTGTEAEFAEKLKMEFLPTSGGTMTGPINMTGQPITGLIPPTEEAEAANKGYVDGSVRKAAPRNLLDNSDFRHPVNQRGGTTYTDLYYQYCIDRWITAGTTFNVATRTITGTGELPEHIKIFQILPDGALVIGHKYTLAAKINNNIYLLNYTHGSYAQIGTDFGFLIIWPDSKTVEIRINQATSIVVDWVALVEGEYTADTLPEYRPKGYAAELAECQRYCCILKNFAVSGYFTASAKDFQSDTIHAVSNMRATPTLGINGAIVVRTVSGYSTASGFGTSNGGDASLLSGVRVGSSGIRISFPDAATNVNNSCGSINISGTAVFSADL